VKIKLYKYKLFCWVLVSYIALEQSDTTLRLNYEPSEGHCSSWEFHPFI